MTKSGFVVFLLLIFCKSYSQQSYYFVLIQAENNQAFYARIDQKIVSSSSSGYLMIPQLKDSTYDLSIGFPNSLLPELRFLVKINRKDQDFQLKNLGEKGWVLFNYQTQELNIQAKEDTNMSQSVFRGVKEDNAFSRLMAGVVNDSSILYNTFIPAAIANDSVYLDSVIKTLTKKDSILAMRQIKLDSNSQNSVVKTTPKIKKKPTKTAQTGPTSVQKLSEQSSNSSLQLVYLDKSKQKAADTVNMVIPFDNKKVDLAPVKDSAKIDSSLNKKPEKTIILINSDCKNFANDNDLEKLRKKIMNENDEKAKIILSTKYFKTKCFSVKQIMSLSDLFPIDEWRFNFFDAAYPFISDSDNFLQLADLLSDGSYITRLKALVSKP